MRLFHRTTLTADLVLSTADAFFTELGLTTTAREGRTRTFTGTLGTLDLLIKTEGGHYTVVEAHTDQIGESRLDKNVKKFFVAVHKQADPRHRIDAAY